MGRSSLYYGRQSRKRERHQHVAEFLFSDLWMPSRSNHEILLSTRSQLVRHWSGVCAGWQLCFPQLFAGFDVEAADVGIGRTGDEHDAARGDNWSAETDRSRGNL